MTVIDSLKWPLCLVHSKYSRNGCGHYLNILLTGRLGYLLKSLKFIFWFKLACVSVVYYQKSYVECSSSQD